MKKYFGLILAGLMMTTPVLADTTWEKCNSNNGGTLVTVGGQTFCKATSDMNWWSAYAWCDAIDGYLPSITELCLDKSIVQGASCGVNYGARTWSATAQPGTSRMWVVEQGYFILQRDDMSQMDKSARVYCLKKNS